MPLLLNMVQLFVGQCGIHHNGVYRVQLFQTKPSAINPQIDPEMDAIVSKAVAYDPENRYASCREFMKSLKDYQERLGE